MCNRVHYCVITGFAYLILSGNKMKNITTWAFMGTGIWLAGIGVWLGLGWDQFKCMPPNEWGDFLAGTISPLALCWLVVGYIRQGQELNLNTTEIRLQREALMLQQRELAEQVKATLMVAGHAEQQAAASVAMVEISKAEKAAKDLEAIMKTQPSFNIRLFGREPSGDQVYVVSNDGSDAFDIVLHCGDFERFEYNFINPFDSRMSTRISFRHPRLETSADDFDIGVNQEQSHNLPMAWS